MSGGRIAVIVAALAAVIVAVVLAGGGGGGSEDGGGAQGAKAPSGALAIPFAYSPEKEALLKPLVEEFNASGAKVGGKAVFVELQNITSGDAQVRIAKQEL